VVELADLEPARVLSRSEDEEDPLRIVLSDRVEDGLTGDIALHVHTRALARRAGGDRVADLLGLLSRSILVVREPLEPGLLDDRDHDVQLVVGIDMLAEKGGIDLGAGDDDDAGHRESIPAIRERQPSFHGESAREWSCMARRGWRRLGRKRSRYVDARGVVIADEEQLERIRSLAIPPAWTDVWVSPSPRARLQATGLDSAGRKQYLYHASFRAAQEREKFERLLVFAKMLPRLRSRTTRHLRLDPYEHEWTCAVAVGLINKAWFRVGSDRHAGAREPTA
jgi:hypothetical protein